MIYTFIFILVHDVDKMIIQQGNTCAEPCPPDSYGYNCREQCECHDGGSCDPVSGNCLCSAGYTGERSVIDYKNSEISNYHGAIWLKA